MIVVCGYYFRHNLGDEAYKIAFPLLFRNSAISSEFNIIFANPYDLKEIPADCKLLICGGGDIINDWFNEAFLPLFASCKVPIYAVSIGITYESTLNKAYLGNFSKIYVRHNAYPRELATIVGTNNVFHIPDIAFLIKRPASSLLPALQLPALQPPALPIIGVFVATGTDELTTPLVNTLKSLSGYRIVFYAFNTSPIEEESDVHWIQQKYILPNQDSLTASCPFEMGPIITSVYDMMEVISTLHLSICGRYHSHIFSIIEHTPFVSIGGTPKVKYLMEDAGFTHNVAFNGEQISRSVMYALIPNVNADLRKQCEQVHKNFFNTLSTLQIPLSPAKSLDQIKQEARFLVTSGHNAETIASSVLYNITGSVKNKYSFGFVQNILAGIHSIDAMVDWVFHDHKNSQLGVSGLCLLQLSDEFSGVHRSGWEFVVNMMKSLQTPDGILCDTYSDGTFMWHESTYKIQGTVPFRKPWIGFLHHTGSPLAIAYSDNNLVTLFNKESFIISLRQCKSLIVLSSYLQKWVQERLKLVGFPKIPVHVLKHPTEFTSLTFNFFNFNARPKIVQIGAWLRDPYAIYQAKVSQMKKFVLCGPNMNNYRHPANVVIKNGINCIPGKCNRHERSLHTFADSPHHSKKLMGCSHCRCNTDCIVDLTNVTDNTGVSNIVCCRPNTKCVNTIFIQFLLVYLWNMGAPEFITIDDGSPGSGCHCTNDPPKKFDITINKLNHLIATNRASVEIIEKVDNAEFDKILSNSAVFIKLVDASAVNTIIECIMRNTPIIVNKHPAVVEYLGHSYPLYYDIDEHENFDISWIDHNKIKEANRYLTKLDKNSIAIDTFIQGLKNILSSLK